MTRQRWIVLIVILVIFGLGILVEALWGTFGQEATDDPLEWEEMVITGEGDNKIVQLFVTGIISGEAGGAGTPPMTEILSAQLRHIEEDESVKGVVLRIDTPGGEVVATDEIHQRLMRMKQKRSIPVVVSMGSTAASGGYYLATAGDRIFANRNTITGSLGVIFTLPNYAKTASRFGLREYVIKSGKYKDIGNPMRPLQPDEQRIFQTLVNESYQNFVDVIVQGRKLPRGRVLDIADGRVYSGMQAKALGLVDEFGDLDAATDYARNLAGDPDAQVVRYTETFSLEHLLFGLQKRLTGEDPFGLKRLIDQHSAPRLLYQYLP